MTTSKTRSTRRSFFLHGGAVLGAGVAAAAVAGDDPAARRERTGLPGPVDRAEEREAIRQLQLSFMALIEAGRYEQVADLFVDGAELQLHGAAATGLPAIRVLFAERYRRQAAGTLHRAFRQNPLQRQDAVSISEDGLRAAARFHVEVELCVPLQGHSTIEAMARLQGNMADRRWESGRFDATYAKVAGQWKLSTLHYQST